MNNLKERKIGSLWLKKDKNKQQFLSGELVINKQVTRIIIFKNLNKKLENHPDWEIFTNIEAKDLE
jgi:hypothetical protein